MSDEQDHGQLIPFPRAPDDTERGPLEADRPGFMACKHPRPLSLDAEAHELLCQKCGQRLDPFDFLLELTDEWERYNRGYKAARQQERAALARVETLKRLEKNAKARIRKHGVVLSSAQASVVRSQLRGLQHVVINLAGSVDEAQRLARLNGVDSERLLAALHALSEQLDLEEEHAITPA